MVENTETALRTPLPVVIKNVLTAKECEALKKDLYQIEAAFRETGDLPAGMDPNTFTFFTGTSDSFFRVDNLPHLTKSFYDYVTHPRLLAIMEEICGTEVRLEQSDAAIRRPSNPGGDTRKPGQGVRLTKFEHRHVKSLAVALVRHCCGPCSMAFTVGSRAIRARPTSTRTRACPSSNFPIHVHHGSLPPLSAHRVLVGLDFHSHRYHYTFVKTLTNLSDLGPNDGGTVVIPGR